MVNLEIMPFVENSLCLTKGVDQVLFTGSLLFGEGGEHLLQRRTVGTRTFPLGLGGG
jgi:hypothetical protein